MTLASLRTTVLAALACAWAIAPAAAKPSPRATARPPVRDTITHVPTLLVPQQPDSVPAESAPAPLLIPRRGSPGEPGIRSGQQRAREQCQLGLTRERQQMKSPAILAYTNAIKLDPAIRDAAYRMGMILNGVGDTREAAQAFASEVERHPDNT